MSTVVFEYRFITGRKEIAEFLGVKDLKTVDSWIKAGLVPVLSYNGTPTLTSAELHEHRQKLLTKRAG